MKIYAPRVLAVAALAAVVISESNTVACGLDWATPKGHFEGVDEQGKLSYWEKIGKVDLGKGVTIPLIIGFESSHNFSSPYLGEGWTFALLDSKIFQVDDKRFVMVQPDGWTSRLGRKEAGDTTLTGQRGFMAEINGNEISVWAKCGWKMVFTDGKITSITTPQNQILNYIYDGGMVKEIDADGDPVLRVERDSGTGTVTGLQVNGDRISIVEGKKPRIENINGKNVVGEVGQSLNTLTRADGSVENFKFSVTNTLLPTLEISGTSSRSFTWDPTTELLLRDGEWSYNIVPAVKQFSNAQITRTNKSGESEFWFNDENGNEITQDLNGTRTTKEVFKTGILKGKIRKIEEVTKDGRANVLYGATYDETGKLIRMVQGRYMAMVDKKDNSFEIVDLTSGKKLWQIQKANNGTLNVLSGLDKIQQ